MKREIEAGTISIREIVETVIRNHPRECIFATGAVDRIVADAVPFAHSKHECITYIAEAVRREEVYCPHEGIDRRAECGVAP